jgi:drug/metabolite transporter, DME family
MAATPPLARLPGGRPHGRGGERSPTAGGYLYVLLAAALWAALAPGSRLLLEEGVGAFEIALWRSLIAWALFAAHVSLARRSGRPQPPGAPSNDPRVHPRDIPGLLAFGVFGIAVLYVSLPLAVGEGGAALASVLLYTAPAWVAALGWPLLGERLDRRKAIALALTLAGIAAFGLSGGEAGRPSPAAIGFGLLSGLSYASLYLFGKRYFARYSSSVVFLWALPPAIVLVLPATDFAVKSAIAWATLVTLGGLSTYGAYLAYSAGLRRLEATRASVIATLEPVLAGLLAFSIWGERFALTGYAGGALILAGVVLMATSTKVRRDDPSAGVRRDLRPAE